MLVDRAPRSIQAPLLVVAVLAVPLGFAGLTSPDGPTLGQVDARVNVVTASDQGRTVLAAAGDGSLVAAWESHRQEAGYSGVYARRLDAAGRAMGDEVRLHGPVRGDQRRPAVAWDGDGAWFVWQGWGRDGSGSAVVARHLGPDLAPVGPEIAVNRERRGDQAEPAVAAGPAGVLAAWTDAGAGVPTVRARRLDTDGPERVIPSREGVATASRRSPRAAGMASSWRGAAPAVASSPGSSTPAAGRTARSCRSPEPAARPSSPRSPRSATAVSSPPGWSARDPVGRS